MADATNACIPELDLSQFVQGNLDAARLRQIAVHVDDCAACQDTVFAIAEQSDTFVGAIRTAGQIIPPPQDHALKLGLNRMIASLRSRGPSPSAQPLPNHAIEQLGPYKIEYQLGNGGMGHVYRATHTKLKRSVAIKVLTSDRWSNTLAVSRFEREMAAIGSLDHPHIVRASDAGEDRGMHYLVMDYVDGLDLSRLVTRLGQLPTADACELARQAAIGLQHAHDNGLIHRDIKPSNLILARSPATGHRTEKSATLKILDLGLALLGDEHLRENHELTTVGALMGTLDYMSPEQGVDSHSVDQRTDIYSLGATLFKLLTGRAPYADPQYSTLMKKMTALATKPAPSLSAIRPDVPVDLVAIVDRMLARDPDDRFSAAQEVADALAPLAERANLCRLLERGLASEERDLVAAPPLPLTAVGSQIAASPTSVSDKGQVPNRGLLMSLAAGMLATVGAVLFYLSTNVGELKISSDDPNATIVVKRGDATIRTLKMENEHEKITLRVGDYELEVTGDASVSIEPSKIAIGRGATQEAHVATRGPYSDRPSSSVGEKTARNQAAVVKASASGPLIDVDSQILIQVLGTSPERPISGIFTLEPSGNVHLGPGYGRVKIEGLTLEEAEHAIQLRLLKELNSAEVMVTLPRHAATESGGVAKQQQPYAVPFEIGGPAETRATYQGATYDLWLRNLQTQRDEESLESSIRAVGHLGAENSKQASRAILNAMRTSSGPRIDSTVPIMALVSLDHEAVLQEILDEFESGNGRSRDFLRALFYELNRQPQPSGDIGRLRQVFAKNARAVVKAILASPQKDPSFHFLLCLAEMGADVRKNPEIHETLDELSEKQETPSLQVRALLVLVEHAPETPGLARRIYDHRGLGGLFDNNFGESPKSKAILQMGRHAAPILEDLIRLINAEFTSEGDVDTRIVLSGTAAHAMQLIRLIASIGVKTQPAVKVLTIVSRCDQPTVAREAERALRKISEVQETEADTKPSLL